MSRASPLEVWTLAHLPHLVNSALVWSQRHNKCSETQVVQLTLLKTRHLSLMILDSSLSTAMSITHVHGCTHYYVATPMDGSPTINEEPSLVQKDKRQHNSVHIVYLTIC